MTDLIVNDLIVVELKVVEALLPRTRHKSSTI